MNDGLLVTEASIDEKIAKVTSEYCPGLNKCNLVSNTIEMSRQEYLWHWRNMTYKLLDIAEQ